ncbi:MAG: hypothetical protein A2018_00400 [Alphaproteobacteria bacterium GWF2_58_20]|nr:MAG: hypothetical protein A2018_00400 [Alphaproteobacteria bacterium GWF2_58_20]
MIDFSLSATPKEDPVRDAGVADFEPRVLHASMKTPVLVDFWAPWCGPCRQLLPLMEKLVRAQTGRLLLVKVNIDENPELAQALHVQSVPTVMAFWQGRPVDGFMGAQPESELVRFMDRLLALVPTANPPVEDEDPLALAKEAMQEGDAATASALYSRILASQPDHLPAMAGLAKCHVAIGEVAKARAILDRVPEARRNEECVISAMAALEISEQVKGLPGVSELAALVESRPDDLAARYDLALALLVTNSRESAAGQLLEILRRNRNWENGKARAELLKFLDAWGFDDPLSVDVRRKLSSFLFS